MHWFPHLLIAALAWGALSFGAVYPWGHWPLAVGCAGLGLWAIAVYRPWEDPRTRKLGIALLLVAAAIGVQAITLPYSVVLKLSPGVDQFLRQYQLVYRPASAHPLSLVPDWTGQAFALFVAFALLLVGLIWAVRRMRLEWLMNQILGFGVALAFIGVVQKALLDPAPGAEQVLYGVWRLERVGSPFGPFINRNHFAGWMLMMLPLVVGYSFAVLAQSRLPRAPGWGAWLRWTTTVEASRFMIVAFGALVMGTALVLTGSRSGLISFAVGMGLFGLLAIRSPHGRGARKPVMVYLGAMLLAAVVWAGADTMIARFAAVQSDAGGRIEAWRDTTRIIRDFPLFGTGMGSYPRAMLIYQTADRERMYAQAHNEYLQILAEGGVLVSLPAAVVLVLVIAGIRRRLNADADSPTTFWVRAGAIAGLVGIATQSLVEFSLQIPGNRVPFVILLAIALHRPSRQSRPALS
jgi:hypothetical protein